MHRGAGILAMIAIAASFVARLSAPSDLYDNDQPKTIAYTLDMVENENALVPRDMLGRPTTKPPLINWLSVPFIRLGDHHPLALSAGAMLSTLATLAILFAMTRWTLLRCNHWRDDAASNPFESLDVSAGFAAMGGLMAIAVFVTCASGIKLPTFIRPDSALTACMTGAWACGTLALLLDDAARKRIALAAGFWIFTGLAFLAKGPTAFIAIGYILIASKWLTGRWSTLKNMHFSWGFPLAIVLGGFWPLAAWLADPEGFGEGMSTALGGTGNQSIQQTLHDWITEWWKPFVEFLARFAPWSIPALLAILHLLPRRTRSHPVAPAVLWVVLMIAVIALSPRRRADYILPALAPAALAATWWILTLARQWKIKPWHAMLLACCAAIALGFYHHRASDAAKTRFGDHAIEFTRHVRQIARDEPILFIDTGYNEVQSLLGYNQSLPPEDSLRRDARWIIRPLDPDEADPSNARLISELISNVHSNKSPGRLALFPAPMPAP